MRKPKVILAEDLTREEAVRRLNLIFAAAVVVSTSYINLDW
jgi:hypothetical protein